MPARPKPLPSLHKTPPAPSEDAEKFVEQADGPPPSSAPASSRSAPASSGPRARQKAADPPADRPTVRATYRLDATLHHRLAIAAAVHRLEHQSVVAAALEAYLPRLEGKRS